MKTLELCDFTEILVSVCNYCNNEKPALYSNSSHGEYESEYICLDCINLAFGNFEVIQRDNFGVEIDKCPDCQSDKIQLRKDYTIRNMKVYRNWTLYCFGKCQLAATPRDRHQYFIKLIDDGEVETGNA
jgi:hypothetical protein